MSLIVIAAEHPTLGLIYRRHVDESLANAQDYYGLTLSAKMATTLERGWREHFDENSRMGERFLHRAMAFADSSDEHMFGSLLQHQLQSGQTPREFYCWLHNATWLDISAPAGVFNPVTPL